MVSVDKTDLHLERLEMTYESESRLPICSSQLATYVAVAIQAELFLWLLCPVTPHDEQVTLDVSSAKAASGK